MFTEKLSRRAFLSRTALVGAGVVLAACAPKEAPAPTSAPAPGEEPVATTAPAPADKEPVTVRFMSRADAIFIGAYEQCIKDDFETAHPDIKVSVEPAPDGWVEKLLAQMIAGTAVDLFQAWGNIFYNWTDRGLLLDCQPYVDRDMTAEEVADYNEFQWEGLFMKGIRVGMPKYINLMTISINKDLFDKYGVDYPPEDGEWTRDDYREMMGTLTEAARTAGDNNVWAGWLPMWSWDRFWGPVKSWGGEVVDSKYGKTCLLDSEASMAALQWAYDIQFKDNFHAQPAQVENKWPDASFGPGLVMSCEDGTYPITREETWYEEAGIRWDMRHVPKGPNGGRSVLGTTDAWSITKQTKAPDAAWELLHFLSGPVFQKKVIVDVNGIIPVLKPLIDDFITSVRKVKPRMEDVRLETIKEILEWGYAEDGPWFCDTVGATEIINPALEKVYTVGDVGPEYLLDIVQQVNDGQKDCVSEY